MQGETLRRLVRLKYNGIVVVFADTDTQGAGDIGDIGSAVEDARIEVIGRHRISRRIQFHGYDDGKVCTADTNSGVFSLYAVRRWVLLADAAGYRAKAALDESHGGRVAPGILLITVGDNLELGVLLQ
ncbi:MAG: hypothetical protein O2861_14225 [Proteobacteria bacterium]|nr:hypothetical protein [Pseudomonadota bacterium]